MKSGLTLVKPLFIVFEGGKYQQYKQIFGIKDF